MTDKPKHVPHTSHVPIPEIETPGHKPAPPTAPPMGSIVPEGTPVHITPPGTVPPPVTTPPGVPPIRITPTKPDPGPPPGFIG